MSTAQGLQAIQDSLALNLLGMGMCTFWVAHYIGMVYKSFEDHTYSMSLMPLCCNIACEFVYGVIHPVDVSIYSYIFAGWFVLDCMVAFATLKFAPNEWKNVPLVHNNLNWIFAVSIAGWVTAHLALVAQFGTIDATAWSAWFCQLLLSAGCLCQLIVRGNSRGASLFLW
jgi:paspaline synthase